MATQRYDLEVEVRKTGKHWARKLRTEKRIPAVIYGAVKENLHVSIRENDVLKYRTKAFENALFNLNINGQSLVALIKEVQKHPVTHKPEHVDLLAIDLNKAIRIPIEIRVEGKPMGLADGGLLTVVNRTIEIECLPTQIPDAIVADVSGLGVGESLHVSDLNIPQGVKVISPADMTIAVVNLPEEEKAAEAAPEAAAAAAAPAAAAGAAAKTPAAKEAEKKDKK
ncbi:MAG: 50S ribosomal protein L25 [Bdellovibrionaceae bacterium]|jgi:large subunit ribosomal protein L25|nr:50S ribosomal protein L25 [Pseudobdellovibrionaceae bacterium]